MIEKSRGCSAMRIIAGERRGHKINGPKNTATRPTSDLVRESLFNILREAVVGRVVVDLFAGTGALGLEALSRGAERAIFVEQNRDNVALIYRNLATLRYEDRVRVLAADAYRWARSFTPADDEPLVVLLDPPYREYEIRWKKVNQLLSDLVRKLPAGSVIAVESGRGLGERVLPDFDAWDIRRYGGTHVAIRVVASRDGPGGTSLDIPTTPSADSGPTDDEAETHADTDAEPDDRPGPGLDAESDA
jgi:16S rRNA (guanine966-N2)-methyltransferase